jgi:hypothetical protein
MLELAICHDGPITENTGVPAAARLSFINELKRRGGCLKRQDEDWICTEDLMT